MDTETRDPELFTLFVMMLSLLAISVEGLAWMVHGIKWLQHGVWPALSFLDALRAITPVDSHIHAWTGRPTSWFGLYSLLNRPMDSGLLGVG